MLSIQAFVNMAVAVNLIPVTGQPLPLISRGGTSTLITCAYFGLILSADRFGIGKKKRGEQDDDRNGAEQNEDDNTHRDETSADADGKGTINRLEDKVEFEIYHI